MNCNTGYYLVHNVTGMVISSRNDFYQIVYDVYAWLMSSPNSIDKLVINVAHSVTPTYLIHLCYVNKHVVIIYELDNIKYSFPLHILYPAYHISDSLLSSKIGEPKSRVSRNNTLTRHNNKPTFIKSVEAIKPVEAVKPVEAIKPVQAIKPVEEPVQVNFITTKKCLDNNVNECHITKFQNDKQSYFKIKHDVETGRKDPNEISTYFVVIYDILDILNSRGVLCKNDDSHLYNEYHMFIDLYESCFKTDDEDDDEVYNKVDDEVDNEGDDEVNNVVNNKVDDRVDGCNNISVPIYVPDDYESYSEEQKERYASKYRMSLDDFTKKLTIN